MKCSAGLQHAFTAGLIDVLRTSESKGDFAFQVISHLPPPKRGESTARNPPGVCKKSPSPGGRYFGRKIRRRKKKNNVGAAFSLRSHPAFGSSLASLVEQRSGAHVLGPTSSLLALENSSRLDSGLSPPRNPLWGAGCDLGLAEGRPGGLLTMSVLATAGAGNRHHLSFMLGK